MRACVQRAGGVLYTDQRGAVYATAPYFVNQYFTTDGAGLGCHGGCVQYGTILLSYTVLHWSVFIHGRKVGGAQRRMKRGSGIARCCVLYCIDWTRLSAIALDG